MSLGINLHQIVRSVIPTLHPDETVLLVQSTGSVNVRGRVTPQYAPVVAVGAQIQSLGNDDLQAMESEARTKISRKAYLFSTTPNEIIPQGIIRTLKRGGDLLWRPDGSWWLVSAMMEDFSGSGWVCVQLTEQIEVPEEVKKAIDDYRNAYTSLTDVAEYLFEAQYDTLDYANAYQHFKGTYPVVLAGCTSVRCGDVFARNFDWQYSESADFVVHTPRKNGLNATLGVASTISGLDNAFVKSRAYSESYALVPFFLVDGINEHGLAISTHVAPNEKGNNAVVHSLGKQEVELCTLMLPRYVLDHFSSAYEAATWLQEHASIYHPRDLQMQGYDQHFMLADSENTLVLEFKDGQLYILDVADKPYMTNFHLLGTRFNADGTVLTPATLTATETPTSTNGITPQGSGLERYNMMVEAYPELQETGGIYPFMESLFYTRAYDTNPFAASPRWDTEFVGIDRLTVDSPTADYDAIQEEAGQEYLKRTRDAKTTWQTVHSSIYKIDERQLALCVQEQDEYYTFSLNGAAND